MLVVHLCLFAVVGVGSTYGLAVDQMKTCVDKCEKNHSGPMAVSCVYGCKRAALLKRDNFLHPTCYASCIEKYPDENNRNTCKDGCDFYSEDENSLLSSPLNFFSKLFHLRNSLEDANENATSSGEKPNPVKLVVIRRIRFRVPPVDDSEPEDTFNDAGPVHQSLPLVPYNVLPMLHDEPQRIGAMEEPSRMTKMASVGAADSKVLRPFHYMGSHPLIILFAITLLALCVLLVVQVTLECKRRRRAAQFQFSQFDQLPSYVEATTVKIPADGNQNTGATNDSNKV